MLRPNSFSRLLDMNKWHSLKYLAIFSFEEVAYNGAGPHHKTWGFFTDRGSATYKLSICHFTWETSNKHLFHIKTVQCNVAKNVSE